MRRRTIWKSRLAVVMGVTFLLMGGCTQKSTSGFKPNSEPDGFAGMKWELDFPQTQGAEWTETRFEADPSAPDKKIKIWYVKKGDDMKMGDSEVEKIEYGSWKGKFSDVQIMAKGPENFDKLKKVFFERYGTAQPTQGVYVWNGPVTRISLRYDEATKTSTLTIGSTKLTFKEIFSKD